MGKKRPDGCERDVPQSINCNQNLWKALGRTFPDEAAGYKTRSDWFRSKAKERVANFGGVTQQVFDYEQTQQRVATLTTDLKKVVKALESEYLEKSRQSAFVTMYNFAVKLVGSGSGELACDKRLLDALDAYEYRGSEPFERVHLEGLIRFVELKIVLKPLLAGLDAFRKGGRVKAAPAVVADAAPEQAAT